MARMEIPSVSRRRFLAGGAAFLGAASLGQAMPSKYRGKTISIFHTTDLHGHIVPTVTYDGMGDVGGMARCITQIRQWRKENPDSLLLDIGDIYQGTAVGLESNGSLMIDLFNRIGYDAWALGNHDFDWGRDAIDGALARSKSPILAGNLSISGKIAGSADGPWQKVKPWMVKEVAGIRIGLIGLITPGLPFWLSEHTLGGVAPLDPVELLKQSIKAVRAEKVDAIVVMGHMGWRYEDDFANPVRNLLESVEGVDVYLGGHSHQDQPSWMTGKTLCTQANYYGIHCGRVDLTFDTDTHKLLNRRAFTVLMDSRFDLDPAVMEMARPDLAKADEQMARKIGDFKEPVTGTGRGNGLCKLMCQAFDAALKRQGHPVDGVFHGTFNTGDIAPGPKTVSDCWDWLPYENELVVGEISAADLLRIVAEDRTDKKSDRELWPFEVVMGPDRKVQSFLRDGKPVASDARFKIALNTYDAQSGGQRMMVLREIMDQPSTKRVDTGVPTRGALIDYLLERV